MQGINPNSQPMRDKKKKKKIEKTHAKENNHMHKTIFTWFGNLPTSTELQGFHYYQERIQVVATVFSDSQKHGNNTHHKTLITKVGSTMAYRLKPLLHGLNLSKSPIKNHTTLFGLSRVIKPDQTKLGSTKPDRTPKPNRAPKPYYVVLQNN